MVRRKRTHNPYGSGGHAYTRHPGRPAPPNHCFPQPTEPGGICPVCGLGIRVLGGGKVGSHRVGPTQPLSWPCLGVGQTPRPLETS